jgi:hypothetical protein
MDPDASLQTMDGLVDQVPAFREYREPVLHQDSELLCQVEIR